MRAIVAEALGARTTLTQSCFARYRGFLETTISILNSLNSSVLSPPQRPSDLIAQLGSLG